MDSIETIRISSIDELEIDSSINGIIFDYGGTLDSRGDHWSHIILDSYRSTGLDIHVDAFIDAYIYGERALASRPAILQTDTFRELMRKKITIETDWLLANKHITLADAKLAGRIADRCYEHARECVAESSRTLNRLAGSYPMVLVSNFYGNINAVLSDFGIRDCFKTVIESAVVGIRKPDPGIFRLGIDALGLRAGEVLVVGDSISKDILPAQSLGCRTALVTGRPWPPKI